MLHNRVAYGTLKNIYVIVTCMTVTLRILTNLVCVTAGGAGIDGEGVGGGGEAGDGLFEPDFPVSVWVSLHEEVLYRLAVSRHLVVEESGGGGGPDGGDHIL